MTSLPAVLEGAESRLGLGRTATGFVLPLSLAVFKHSGPVWFITVTCFVGRLDGVSIHPAGAVAGTEEPLPTRNDDQNRA